MAQFRQRAPQRQREEYECPADVAEAVARALMNGDYDSDSLRSAVTGYARQARAVGMSRAHAIAELRRCIIAQVPVAFVIDEVGELWLNLLHWVYGVYHSSE